MAPSGSSALLLNPRHNYCHQHLLTFTALPLPSRVPPSTCSNLLYTLPLPSKLLNHQCLSVSHSWVRVLSSSSSAAFQALILDFDSPIFAGWK